MLTPSEILFSGSGYKETNIPELARAMGKDQSTLNRWKKEPHKIKFGNLQQIVRLQCLTDRQILNLFGRG